MFHRRLVLKAAAVAVAAGMALPCFAQAETLKIQAMRVNTGWYFFGATLAKLLQDKVPAGTNVEVVPKGGGVGNIISVDTGKAQMGLANVSTANWGWGGHKVVYKGKKYQNIRALAGGLNSVWFVAMVRKGYLEDTGFKSMEEILTSGKPVRISMKPAGSTVPVVADMLLGTLGLDRAAIKKGGGEFIQVAAKQLPDLVRDERTDIYFESAFKGHPAVTQADHTGKVTFMDLPAKSIDALAKAGLIANPMPAYFKGQSGATQAVDFGTLLIAHKDMSDDLAYLITKTVCENKDAMVAAHKAWKNFNPENAWKKANTGIPLHPGAQRYYKERGWM
jgi:uncharacterized protein